MQAAKHGLLRRRFIIEKQLYTIIFPWTGRIGVRDTKTRWFLTVDG